MNFEEQILEAAKSIAAATSALVKAASAAQRELVAQGKVRTQLKDEYSLRSTIKPSTGTRFTQKTVLIPVESFSLKNNIIIFIVIEYIYTLQRILTSAFNPSRGLLL